MALLLTWSGAPSNSKRRVHGQFHEMNATTSLARRLQYLASRYLLRKKFLIAYAEPYDTHFKFSIRDGIGKDIYYKWGVYSEDFITRYILEQVGITDSDLVLDIGANIGWYSLVLSSRQHPTILAFEPDPTNFSLLKENIALNKRTTVKAFNLAIAGREGTMQLFLYKKYNQGRHSLIAGPKSGQSVSVQTVVLDRFLQQQELGNRPIKFLKIDIEGFEFTALKGARETLSRTEFVLSEFSPAIMQQINESPMEFVWFMEGFGFKGYELTDQWMGKANFDMMIEKGEVYDILWKRG